MATRVGERRLSAILAADVAGYTSRMEEDSDGTVAAWRAAREDVVIPTLAEHSGRIVKHTGDGFLAEFPTVQDAVRCAIAMQESLTTSPLDFRMGVNLGDIIDDGKDIHGEGVNIAARIESLADAGGICISASVHEQVRHRLDYCFADMGEIRVKNVSMPVRVIRILTDGGVPTSSLSQQQVKRWSAGPRPILLLVASAGTIAVIAGIYFAGGIISSNQKYPFDGRWKVTVSSKSGCGNNNSKSYSMTVLHGLVNETQHRKPKTGSISNDGEFVIEVTDSSGELRNTQSGKITGYFGKGRLQGRKPTCIGDVTLERLRN
jgi:class 3 adenylate cyclase